MHPRPQSGTSPGWFVPPGPLQAKIYHNTALELAFPSLSLSGDSCYVSLQSNQYFHTPIYSAN